MQKFQVGDLFFHTGVLIGPIIDFRRSEEGVFEYKVLRHWGECFWYKEETLLFQGNKVITKVKTLWDVLQ